MNMKHLIWALLCVNCGGGEFSANEHEATSDGGLGGKPAVGVTSDDASVAPDGAPFVGGSGGVAGLDGSGARDSGGSPDGNSSAGGSSGSDGGSGECATSAVQCVGAQRQTCIGGIWLDNGAACDGWCLNGACVDCKPEDRSCTSRSQPQTCGASGSWVSDAACNIGQGIMCSAGECVSPGPSCTGTGLCGVECTATEACVGCALGTNPTLSSCRHAGDSVTWGVSSYCCPWDD